MITFNPRARGAVTELSFSPDSQLLAIPTGANIEIRDAASGTFLNSARTGGGLYGFWSGPNQQSFVACKWGIGLTPVGPKKGKAPAIEGSAWLNSPLFAPDGSRAVDANPTGEGNLVGYQVQPSGVTQVWSTSLGPTDGGWSRSKTTPLAFLPGSNQVVAVVISGGTARLQVWGWLSTATNNECQLPFAQVACVAPSPDGVRLAVVSGIAPSLLLYNTSDLSQPPQRLVNPVRRQFAAAAFHPSGKYLAVADKDSGVTFFDTATWKVAKTFDWKIGKLRCVAFSPDGALAAVGSDKGQVVVWDVDV